MKDLLLRKSFWGIAAAVTAMIMTAEPVAAQCVSGAGASNVQFASQEWSRRSEEITAFAYGNSRLTLQRPTQIAADKSGSVYVLDAGVNTIIRTTGYIGPQGLPSGTPNLSSLHGNVVQIRFAGGFLWALTDAGYLTTPFLLSTNPSYTEIRVSGSALADVIFDGQYLLVSDNSRNLFKVLPPTSIAPGSLVSKLLVGNSATPGLLSFDGQHVWAATGNRFVEIDSATGAVLNDISLSESINSLTFDGIYFWLGGAVKGGLTKVDPFTVKIAASYAVAAPDPKDLVFDGKFVWVPNSATNSLTTVRACDGATGTVNLPGAPSNLAFDGNSVWITYKNSTAVSIR